MEDSRAVSPASRIRVFLEMIKFEHTVFALPFAYTGMFLAAGGWPSWEVGLWVTVALAAARTLAMAANRLVDKDYDARNPRTATRLFSGRVGFGDGGYCRGRLSGAL